MIEAHVAELGEAYVWLREIPAGDERRDGAALVDLILGEKLEWPAPPPETEAISSLLRALQEIGDRRTRRTVLAGFSGWYAAVANHARPAFLAAFPALAPAVHDLGGAGMGQVIDAANRDERMPGAIAKFADMTGPIIRSIAAVSATADADTLERLAALFPVSRVAEDREAERLLERLISAPLALNLVTQIATVSVSSAAGVLRELAGQTLSQEYLHLFENLTTAMGPRACGWCLKRLPELMRKQGPDQAAAVVQAAVGTAMSYGVLAAEALLEGKTRAARDLLG